MPKYRTFFAVLPLLLLSLAFFGCSKAPVAVNTATLKIMLKMGEAFKTDNNPYIRELERLSGLKLEIEAPSPSSYNERLNVVMASGRTPDIVQLNWSGEANFASWARNGLIKPVDLDKAPNVQMNVSKSLLTMMKVGGDDKIYGVPGITTLDSYGAVIRQDWLDKLNVGQPRTLNEYISVLKAFVSNDPDGNGRDDTIGMTSWRLNHFGGVFGGAFRVDYLWNSLHPDPSDKDNVAKLREEQEGYMSFMDFARTAYKEGLLDKDFTSLQNAEDRFVLGKTGMLGAYSGDTVKLEKKLQKFMPNAKLSWILCPGDPDGKIWNFMPERYGYNGAGSEMGNDAIFLITRDADYNRALQFLDRMNSKEMILFSNLGIKDVHYQNFDENRGVLVRNEAQNELVKQELFGIADTYRGERHAYLGDNADENERLDYYWNKGRLLITNPGCFNMGLVPESVKFYQANPSFREKERIMAMKYVAGAISRENYLDYLTNENIQQRSLLSKDLDSRYRQLAGSLN